MSVRGDDPPPLTAATAAYVMLSMIVGATAAFISLEAYVLGIALDAAAGVLLFRQARRYRWFALGGFLLALGLSLSVLCFEQDEPLACTHLREL